MFDLVLRGGTVIDGRGGEPFIADVAISNGQITAVGQIALYEGTEEIDAVGRIVTPGFIDIHTHYDGQVIWDSRIRPSSGHGVTTVLMGNCGVGFAPCRHEDHALLLNVMEGVEDVPEVVMTEGLTWDWQTFPEYLDAVDGRVFDIDVAAQLPHSALRVYVMGERGARREAAGADDLAEMTRLTQEAMSAGALGFGTSRILVHRTSAGNPIPTLTAAEAELQSVADGIAAAGHGVLQVVTDFDDYRNIDGEFAMLVRVAERAGCALSLTVGQGADAPDRWRTIFSLIDDANARGVTVRAQIFPRPIGMIMGHDTTLTPFTFCPTYVALGHLPLADKVVALRRPEVREAILSERPDDPTLPLFRLGQDFERMFLLADLPDYEPPRDASIASQARKRGVSPQTVAYDLMLERDGHAMLMVAIGNYARFSLEDVMDMAQHPHSILALGDGGAHYGLICDASYPTFVLTHLARDRKGRRMSLPAAIQALTRDPARAIGLNDRGVIAAGYKADINIIDHDRLQLLAPIVIRDLPGGGRRLDQRALGYVATIVSGRVIYREGEPTSELPGRLIRGPQRAPANAGV